MRPSNLIFRANRYESAILHRADGCWMWDEDGNKYLDMEAGIWCCNLGHSHPAVNRAAKEQIDRIVHVGSRMLSTATMDAARALLDFIPGDYDKVTFLSSGTEAVELGISIAKTYTGRDVLLSFDRSYLGAYGNASGASGAVLSPDCLKVRALTCPDARCDTCACGRECEAIVSTVERSAGDIACFVFEPVLASGGLIRPCSELIRKLCHIVQGRGGLAVVDEVTTGFGRTGERFGFQHHGVRPDIVAMGKAIGNGFPVSAVVTTGVVEQRCFDRGFYYAQSHMLDPLGCAVVKSVVETLSEGDLIGQAKAKGEKIRECMEAHRKGFVRDVRGTGLAVGAEVCDFNGKKAGEYIDLVSRKLLEKGVYIGISKKYNMLRALPALTIADDEIEFFAKAYAEVVEEV